MKKSVYVSTKGNDNGDGTIAAPFYHIERAILEFSKSDSGTIIIRDGVYEIDKELELKDLSDIVIESYENENVVITGSKKLNYEEFKSVSDENLRALLPHNAVEYDLKNCGITDLGEIKARGFRRPYMPVLPELVVENEVMRIPSYPKNEFYPMGEVMDKGAISLDVDDPDFSDRGGKFKYTDDRISNWKYSDNLLVSGYVSVGYADDTIPVKSIDRENKIIELSNAVMLGLNQHHTTAYKFLNVLDELTEEGEYYIDYETLMLYYIPTPSFKKGCSIRLTTNQEPLISLMNTYNVTLRNLTISNTCGIGIYMEQGSNNVLDGLTISNCGIVGVVIGKGIEPDTEYKHHYYQGKPVSKALGSLHEHMYNDTMFNRDAGTNNTVLNCHIYDCGAGGISMGGGDRKKLIPANNCVKNCTIHDCNRVDKTYKALINIDGVGNRVDSCDLYNASAMAVYVHGNEHIVENSDIYNVCTETDDMGAIYIGRDPSEQGLVIRNNYIHHVVCRARPNVPLKDGMGSMGVYNDDGSCGITIDGNVFYQAGTWAVHSGGSNIKINNNIFVECQTAVIAGDVFWGKADTNPLLAKGGLIWDRLVNQSQIYKPPYSEKYPDLLTYFEEDGKPLRNTFSNNVVYRCLNPIAFRHRDEWYINDYYLRKDGETPEEVIKNFRAEYEQIGNYVIDEIEEMKGKDIDFELLQGKYVLPKLPQFKKIDMKKMGNKM